MSANCLKRVRGGAVVASQQGVMGSLQIVHGG